MKNDDTWVGADLLSDQLYPCSAQFHDFHLTAHHPCLQTESHCWRRNLCPHDRHGLDQSPLEDLRSQNLTQILG